MKEDCMMKKHMMMTWVSLTALFVWTSCSKEQNIPAEPAPAGEQITIAACFPEGGLTKVDFNEAAYNGQIDLVWHSGDQITVTDASNPANSQVFTLASGEGTATASFTGSRASSPK